MENTPLIIDSSLNLEEGLGKLTIPVEIRTTLSIIDVEYISFDNLLHRGQIILHEEVAQEVQEIFKEICALRFPITHAIPVVHYDWDDDASMRENNTSAFNYRLIYNTDRLSNHSYGLAIDINPLLNPQFLRDGTTLPRDATHDPQVPGSFHVNEPVVSLFTSRGWDWGGTWEWPDWQHFAKKLRD